MKKLTLSFLIILCWLQYLLWFGKHGVCDYLNIKNQLSIQEIYNFKLKKQNKYIMNEIYDISYNIEAIEEHARHDLGMIKRGEKYYKIIIFK